MLNVGPLELLVVLAVALIVVGPERLPELARSIGRALRQLRQVQDEVRDMVSGGVDDEIRQAAAEFKEATGDVVRSTGLGDVSRKGRRSARPATRRSPRRETEIGGALSTAPSEPAATGAGPTSGPASRADEPASPTTESHDQPTTVDMEGAGPPADRLVEDGTGPSTSPTSAEAGDVDEAASDR